METRILNEFIKTDAYKMEVTLRLLMAVTSSLREERRDTIQEERRTKKEGSRNERKKVLSAMVLNDVQ
ncbi:hypothetical protein F2Q69_00007416 [Brassica cretica]|uniref:Uncharacterized protein n=1 Tax=Brassica cretica TaxID=69181 RepID=A0A8S9PN29_BRACR|nr:hypothetical protein F2Q69_00007416 [Brassica cretica]